MSAPVFGRPEAAEGAKLAVVAAGPKSAVERCKPVLQALGPTLLVIGERPSMANVVKLTGNFLIATVLESLGEALAFASKSGVDPAAVLDFLTSNLFNAPVYKTYGGLIIESKHEFAWCCKPLRRKASRCRLPACCATAFSPPWHAATKTATGPSLAVLRQRMPDWLADSTRKSAAPRYSRLLHSGISFSNLLPRRGSILKEAGNEHDSP